MLEGTEGIDDKAQKTASDREERDSSSSEQTAGGRTVDGILDMPAIYDAIDFRLGEESLEEGIRFSISLREHSLFSMSSPINAMCFSMEERDA